MGREARPDEGGEARAAQRADPDHLTVRVAHPQRRRAVEGAGVGDDAPQPLADRQTGGGVGQRRPFLDPPGAGEADGLDVRRRSSEVSLDP